MVVPRRVSAGGEERLSVRLPCEFGTSHKVHGTPGHRHGRAARHRCSPIERALAIPDLRVRAPCRWTHDFEWHRTGLVVSLGELMQALGNQFSAKEVYLFYRALRIVALKRQTGSKSQGLLGARQSLTARRGRTKRILQSA